MGEADNLLSFINDELKPLLTKHYRIAPNSVLIGHSYGGILSFYSRQVNPSLFNAHIAISPSIFFDEQALVKSADKRFKNKASTPNFLYMTLADERPEFAESIKAYVNILDQYAPETMQWQFESLPQETHMTSFHPAIIAGLKLLFDDWYIKDIPSLLKNGNIKSVKHHYQKLSLKFGYDIEPPSEMITEAGFDFLSNNRIDEAIAAFQINTLRYPHSGMAHFNLAQTYRSSDREDLSKDLIYKACRIGRQYKEIAKTMFCHEASILGMTE
jgi:pimeloyl-ACP methyl ester carboxylesterase